MKRKWGRVPKRGALYIGRKPSLAIELPGTVPSPLPRIYLDHAATTPVLAVARTAVNQTLERWANPSSPHADGRSAKAALEDARRRIAAALDWDGHVIFTSGATEALSIALGRSDRFVLASNVEHDAVFRAAPDAEIVDIGEQCVVDRAALADGLARHEAPAVAIQHVNPETGVVQPVDELAALVRRTGGLLVSDCSQSAGKLPLPDADVIVISGHKLGGPPGIGALLVRDLAVLHAGGGQERGYRAGTENLPAACGFAAALEWRPVGTPSFQAMFAEQTSNRETLDGMVEQGGGVIVCKGAERSPFVSTYIMPGVASAAQLIQFDSLGFSVSAGSACSSTSLKPSRVLEGFGTPPSSSSFTIRVSFAIHTSSDDVLRFANAWSVIAAKAAGRAA